MTPMLVATGAGWQPAVPGAAVADFSQTLPHPGPRSSLAAPRRATAGALGDVAVIAVIAVVLVAFRPQGARA